MDRVTQKPLSKEQIDEMALGGGQTDFLLRLYRYAFGDLWDRITKVHGYPKVSKATWSYLCDAAISIDKDRHPGVMPGGLWLNNGFTVDESLPDWVVSLNGVKVSLHNLEVTL